MVSVADGEIDWMRGFGSRIHLGERKERKKNQSIPFFPSFLPCKAKKKERGGSDLN
jgi:hypothetical protein